jgi:hypothetical protein
VAVWASAALPFLVLPNGSSAHDAFLLAFLVVTGAVAYVTLARATSVSFAIAEPA